MVAKFSATQAEGEREGSGVRGAQGPRCLCRVFAATYPHQRYGYQIRTSVTDHDTEPTTRPDRDPKLCQIKQVCGHSRAVPPSPRPRPPSRASATMEREIASYLSSSSAELRWGLLPERLRSLVGSEAEWLKLLRTHSIRVQAPWAMVLGGDEAGYLSDMLTASREHGLLYPYHLVEAIAAASKPSARLDTPFEYCGPFARSNGAHPSHQKGS